MNGRRRFVVIIQREDGGVESYPMKLWLRQHPDHIPRGLDATATNAWGLRAGLVKQGWSMTETPAEVRLFPPGSEASEAVIAETIGAADGDDTAFGEEHEAAFALEYQLRDFIAQNLASIRVNGQALQLYVDAMGRDGVEFPSATGPIDILAVADSGAFVVFELKRASSPDRAIGQLARYMGCWVSQTIGKGQEVRGGHRRPNYQSENLALRSLGIPEGEPVRIQG